VPSDLRFLPRKLGATIRELRVQSGLSQMKLAENADLTLNYIGEVERGQKLASIETVVRIARGLGMTGAELLRKAHL